MRPVVVTVLYYTIVLECTEWREGYGGRRKLTIQSRTRQKAGPAPLGTRRTTYQSNTDAWVLYRGSFYSQRRLKRGQLLCFAYFAKVQFITLSCTLINSVRYKAKSAWLFRNCFQPTPDKSLYFTGTTQTLVYECVKSSAESLLYTQDCAYIMEPSLYAHQKCRMQTFARIWQCEASPLVYIERWVG